MPKLAISQSSQTSQKQIAENISKYIQGLGILKDSQNSAIKAQLEILTQQFQETQQRLEKLNAIHTSITGNRIKEAEAKNTVDLSEGYIREIFAPPANIENYVLLDNPYNVPSRRTRPITTALSRHQITDPIELGTSYKNDRGEVVQKLQNTIAFGEHINRDVFSMAHNRFEALKKLVEKIKDTNDLKSLAEVQASIDFLFTAIQNETIKFQATTHSYKSQKALINQRKQQLYATVFSHTNTHMPSLQSITKKF
ncbi:type IV secretion system protein [Bartonella raoultii]|nr:type IV secretion system protein [Bartonella raoultii]